MNRNSGEVLMPAMAEYLLLIEPRKDLAERISLIKEQFEEKYKAPEAVRGKPHLTLVRYAQYPGFENRIRQRLRTLALEIAPVSVSLADYGSFPTHTIFIKVDTRLGIQNIVKKIRMHLQGLMRPDKDHQPHFILEPHITLASRLKPWQYEQGWAEYSHANFSGRFIAEEMSLLRRDAERHFYVHVETFQFQNLPVSASQATLF